MNRQTRVVVHLSLTFSIGKVNGSDVMPTCCWYISIFVQSSSNALDPKSVRVSENQATIMPYKNPNVAAHLKTCWNLPGSKDEPWELLCCVKCCWHSKDLKQTVLCDWCGLICTLWGWKSERLQKQSGIWNWPVRAPWESLLLDETRSFWDLWLICQSIKDSILIFQWVENLKQ